MTPSEITTLARATCAWLDYKGLTGFDALLSEAMLKVPISEYLAAQTTWVLKTEVGYRTLPDADGLPSFWCDFSGTRRYGKGEVGFLLESKFLKRPVDQMAKHIAADIVRLSLPRGRKLVRLFLLAGKRVCFQTTKPTFAFDRLFQLGDSKGCDLKFSDVLLSADFLKSYPMYKDPIKLSKNAYVRPKLAHVRCRAVEEMPNVADGHRVMIWSVSQAQFLQEAPPNAAMPTT
jgi:hypothetical protein